MPNIKEYFELSWYAISKLIWGTELDKVTMILGFHFLTEKFLRLGSDHPVLSHIFKNCRKIGFNWLSLRMEPFRDRFFSRIGRRKIIWRQLRISTLRIFLIFSPEVVLNVLSKTEYRLTKKRFFEKIFSSKGKRFSWIN